MNIERVDFRQLILCIMRTHDTNYIPRSVVRRALKEQGIKGVSIREVQQTLVELGYAKCSGACPSWTKEGREVVSGMLDNRRRGYSSNLNNPKWLRQEIKDRFKHLYANVDGTYNFPNSCEGDILKMVHRLFEIQDQE